MDGFSQLVMNVWSPTVRSNYSYVELPTPRRWCRVCLIASETAMRILFLTDIHGNREALDAALRVTKALGADRTIILGDIVGYGPDPVHVIETVSHLIDDGALCLMGNHDEAAFRGSGGMTPNAKFAIEWTTRQLQPSHLGFLKRLPVTFEEEDRLYVHASAHEPGKWHYVNGPDAAHSCLLKTAARLVFCGHTHIPACYHALAGRKPQLFRPLPEKSFPISAVRRAVIVNGAVGQPRDRISAACYGLYDDIERSMTFHRVPYDADITLRKIKDAGLPEWLGMRLLVGR